MHAKIHEYCFSSLFFRYLSCVHFVSLVRVFAFDWEREPVCACVCVDSYCCRTQQDIHRTDYKIMCVRIILLLLYTLLSFKCSKSDLICTICMWIGHTQTLSCRFTPRIHANNARASLYARGHEYLLNEH